MHIVKIQPRSKNMAVEFDTGDVLEIANDVAVEFVLYAGKVFTDEEIEALRKAQGVYDALSAAYRFLGYRVRSEREVREKLRQKGIALEITELAIEKLRLGGSLDDAVFACKFVHDALLKKPIGQSRLRHELRRKGVSDTAIEQAIAKQYDSGAEFEAGMRLVERRIKKMDNTAPGKQAASLRQYLFSRGFTGETIAAIVNEFLTKDHEQENETS